MATWPNTLPLPMSSGFQLSPRDQTIRTDMEAGAARVRRRSTARQDEVDVAWTLSDAKMAVLRDWFDQSSGAAGGAAWFTVRLRLGTGGVVPVEARFIGPYRASYLGGAVWNVTARLEVR